MNALPILINFFSCCVLVIRRRTWSSISNVRHLISGSVLIWIWVVASVAILAFGFQSWNKTPSSKVVMSVNTCLSPCTNLIEVGNLSMARGYRLIRYGNERQEKSANCNPIRPSEQEIEKLPTWRVPLGVLAVFFCWLGIRVSDCRATTAFAIGCGVCGIALVMTGYDNREQQNKCETPYIFLHNKENVLSTDKKISIIAALTEGSSIRSIERMTGVHRDTIMRLGVKVGQGFSTNRKSGVVYPISFARHGSKFGDIYGALCICGGFFIGFIFWLIACGFFWERNWVPGWCFAVIGIGLIIVSFISTVIGCLPVNWRGCLCDGQNHSYYQQDFVKHHNMLRCTPAMAAGFAGTQWSVGDLLEATA